MFSYDNHFIDSNIILGFVIDWDGLNPKCEKYFQHSCNRYASQNVYNECESVLANVKKWVLNFLRAISKESLTNDEYFEGDIKHIIEKTASEQHNTPMEYRKIIGVLTSFFIEYKLELKNIMNGSTPYKQFRNIITVAFKESRKNFISIFNHLIKKLENHPHKLRFQYRTHKLKTQIHDEDFKIILDAFYFSNTDLKEQLAFITYDKGIFSLKFTIENEFGFKVFQIP